MVYMVKTLGLILARKLIFQPHSLNFNISKQTKKLAIVYFKFEVYQPILRKKTGTFPTT